MLSEFQKHMPQTALEYYGFDAEGASRTSSRDKPFTFYRGFFGTMHILVAEVDRRARTEYYLDIVKGALPEGYETRSLLCERNKVPARELLKKIEEATGTKDPTIDLSGKMDTSFLIDVV